MRPKILKTEMCDDISSLAICFLSCIHHANERYCHMVAATLRHRTVWLVVVLVVVVSHLRQTHSFVAHNITWYDYFRQHASRRLTVGERVGVKLMATQLNSAAQFWEPTPVPPATPGSQEHGPRPRRDGGPERPGLSRLHSACVGAAGAITCVGMVGNTASRGGRYGCHPRVGSRGFVTLVALWVRHPLGWSISCLSRIRWLGCQRATWPYQAPTFPAQVSYLEIRGIPTFVILFMSGA